MRERLADVKKQAAAAEPDSSTETNKFMKACRRRLDEAVEKHTMPSIVNGPYGHTLFNILSAVECGLECAGVLRVDGEEQRFDLRKLHDGLGS